MRSRLFVLAVALLGVYVTGEELKGSGEWEEWKNGLERLEPHAFSSLAVSQFTTLVPGSAASEVDIFHALAKAFGDGERVGEVLEGACRAELLRSTPPLLFKALIEALSSNPVAVPGIGVVRCLVEKYGKRLWRGEKRLGARVVHLAAVTKDLDLLRLALQAGAVVRNVKVEMPVLIAALKPRFFLQLVTKGLLAPGGPSWSNLPQVTFGTSYVAPYGEEEGASGAAERRLGLAKWISQLPAILPAQLLLHEYESSGLRERDESGGMEEDVAKPIASTVELVNVEALLSPLCLSVAKELYRAKPRLIEDRDLHGNSALHVVVDVGDTQTVEWVMEKAPHLLEARDVLGRTPLDIRVINSYGRDHDIVPMERSWAQTIPLSDPSPFHPPDALRWIATGSVLSVDGSLTTPRNSLAPVRVEIEVEDERVETGMGGVYGDGRVGVEDGEGDGGWGEVGGDDGESMEGLEKVYEELNKPGVLDRSRVSIKDAPRDGVWDGIDGCDMDVYEPGKWPPPEIFVRDHIALRRPALIRGGALKWPMRRLWTKDQIEEELAGVYVKSGTYPYADGHPDQQVTSVRKFVGDVMKKVGQDGSSPLYLFDGVEQDKNSSSFKALMRGAIWPPLPQLHLSTRTSNIRRNTTSQWTPLAQSPVAQLFVGATGSGAPEHFHFPAVNAIAYGKKLWYVRPKAEAEYSVVPALETFQTILPPLLQSHHPPMLCVQNAGDAIYLPYSWAHSVLNLRPSVGLAVEIAQSVV